MEKYRNKSSHEWEKEITFLMERDGNQCNKKFGYGCGRSFDQLRTEEERVRRMTGKSKKAPIVQIDHINGNSNQRDGLNGEYCGNEQILCTPCHLKKTVAQRAMKVRKEHILNGKPSSVEMDKNIKYEADWVKQVVNYIYEHHSICYSLARYAFPELSPITTKRYIDKRLVTLDEDTDPMFEDGWGRCNSRLCNSIHLYFYGNAPVEEEPNKE